MRRRSFRPAQALIAMMLIFVAACSDQSTAPQTPQTTQSQPEISDPSLLRYPTGCSKDEINALVNDVFKRPLVRAAVKIEIALFFALNQSGAKPQAKAKLMAIAGKALDASVGETDPAVLKRIASFVSLLYCVIGEPAPPLDLVNGAAQIVNPGETATVGVPDKDPGFNGNLVATQVVNPPVATLVSITPCTVGLDTQLRKTGPCYDITASPELPPGARLVGACINLPFPEGDVRNERIRLAHNLAPNKPVTVEGNVRFGNIEIISPGNVSLQPLSLSCVPSGISFLNKVIDIVLPQKLLARAATGTGGRGGLASNYSPFDGVDPVLTVTANSATTQDGAAGAAVSAPPSVLVKTEEGATVDNVAVSFVPTTGSGSVSGGNQLTSGGVATVGSWVINAGTNTLVATASTPGLSFLGSPVEFTANGAGPVPGFGAPGYSYYTTTDPASAPPGWQTASFPDGWATGAAPFGSLTYCANEPYNLPPVVTNWGIGTPSYVLIRKDFFVPNGEAASIQVLVDNDVQVFLNNVDVSGGLKTHENCANVNPVAPISVTLAPGINKLAIIAKDRGGQSYLDLQVTPAE